MNAPTSPATADLCDAHPDVAVCEPLFHDLGGRTAFNGPIATVKVFEDNAPVRLMLEEPGHGRVLVVDGGGSNRCALVGGNLGKLAADNGWAGIIVYGYVRDAVELAQCHVGVRALGTHPRKSTKGLHAGAREVSLSFGGVTFRPGHWVYADADGIIIAKEKIG